MTGFGQRFFGMVLLGFAVVATFGTCRSGSEAETPRGVAGEESLPDWDGVELADRLWSVGRADGPESQVLGRIGDVAFIGDGLVLSDSYSNRIHWYDPSGRHTRSAGGTGRGPGEFVTAHRIGVLPDGTVVAANDGGGTLEFFDVDGESKESVRFPGSLLEMCVTDSTMVVLGSLEGTDQPFHVMDLRRDRSWTSMGSLGARVTDSPHRQSLVMGLMWGSIECTGDRVIYGRSSDGSVTAVHLNNGAVLWNIEAPSFVAVEHEYAGARGVRHGPPEGATEVHEFRSIARIGDALAVQIRGLDLRTGNWTLSTVFVDLHTGELLGKDDSLPMIAAASRERIAIARETPVPEITVYSITPR